MLFAVLLMVFLAGCSEDLYVDQAFVGTWHWTSNVQWTYVFNQDGTGQRGDADVQSFTWGTRDGTLVLDHGPAFADEEITYTFDGNMLNFISDMGNFDYFRFVPDQSLVGTWVMLEPFLVEATKNSDGTGSMFGFPDYDQPLSFNWFSAGDMLIVHTGPLQQDEWTYRIDGDTLNLASRQVTGYTQEWTRGSFAQNPALLGEWTWDGDDEWKYYFSIDITGERGWIGEEEPFFWATVDDMLAIVVHDAMFGLIAEKWRFTVTGNVLNLVSLDTPGVEFSYVR